MAAKWTQLFDDRFRTEPPLRLRLDVITDIAATAPLDPFHILASDLRHASRVMIKAPQSLGSRYP
jgi:hypothetical protein